MDFFIQASQFVLSLSLLIVLHELGHLIPAKAFKTRVEKFYLFFDYKFSLFKKKFGETEYGIGWIPLGGYVKISGMIDESMDKEQMKKEPEEWEFRSKPAWQRLIIMLGGVTVNILLGVFIYAMILFFYNEKYTPIESMSEGIVCDSLYIDLGFQNGDKIISVDGYKVKSWTQFRKKMIRPKSVIVERGGVLVDIDIVDDFPMKWLGLMEKTGSSGVDFQRPTIVSLIADSVGLKSGSYEEIVSLETSCRAYTEGLRRGDRIVSVNGIETPYFNDYKRVVSGIQKENISSEVFQIIVEVCSVDEFDNTEERVLMPRYGEPTTKTINLTVDVKEGTVGFIPLRGSPEVFAEYGYGDLVEKNYGFFESIPAGYHKTIEELTFYIDQFAIMLIPETGAYKHLGGFGAIGGLFSKKWDWHHFWSMTAFLSIILAFMNVLPIPALDGGHVMFLLYEMVAGKPAPQKVMEYAQAVGMIILLTLVVYANGMDIIRWING